MKEIVSCTLVMQIALISNGSGARHAFLMAVGTNIGRLYYTLHNKSQ